MTAPIRLIHARAPLRINDIGGWTDTWFAGEGKVLNLAVTPVVEVQIKAFPNKRGEKRRVVVHAENYGETFSMNPEKPAKDPHPLLQFAVAGLPGPKDLFLEISLHSPVPAGISTGTSAAVCVALLGALSLLGPKAYSWAEIARLAHVVETERLGQQSGIQDQIAAARGGISFIRMPSYPKSKVQAVRPDERTWNELERRLCLVYLGKPHVSSAMHERVIAELEAGGPQLRPIRKLTKIAQEARDFLAAGELEAYGRSMIDNHECQRALSAGLISKTADAVADIARRFKASGWKVNGAGGEGGSMTVLGGEEDTLRRRMAREIDGMGGGVRVIPVALSPTGLQAWKIK
ncbi:MAG: GHMP kinase [Candidatus Aminicenantes bacterium]|nr:GHMP kinase [Candidatus Aminicenantes bacterium]